MKFSACGFAALLLLAPGGTAWAGGSFPTSCPDFTEGALPSISGCASAGTLIPPDLKASFKATADAASAAMGTPTNGNAAKNANLSQVPCRKTKPYTNEEMESYVDNYGKSKGPDQRKQSRKIRGVQFTNESPAMLDLFEKLVTRSTGDTNSTPDTDLKITGCTQVICALKKLFGPRQGLQIAFLKTKYGFNASYLSWPKSKAWQPKGLDMVMRSLDDFAPGAFPILGGNTQLSLHDPTQEAYDPARDKGSSTPGEYKGAVANMKIQVMSYELASYDNNPDGLEKVLFHELGHQWGENSPLAGQSSVSQFPAWMSLSAWKTPLPPGRKRTFAPANLPGGKSSLQEEPICSGSDPLKPTACPSIYAACNSQEDFAESATEYRFNPHGLWARSPEKYLFLKDYMFNGLEYDSEKSCAPEQSYTARFLGRAKLAIRTPPMASATEGARGACIDLMKPAMRAAKAEGKSYPPDSGLDEMTYRCISGELIHASYNSQMRAGTQWCDGLIQAGLTMKRPYPAAAPPDAVQAAAAAIFASFQD